LIAIHIIVGFLFNDGIIGLSKKGSSSADEERDKDILPVNVVVDTACTPS
jgi:hypothetical protein